MSDGRRMVGELEATLVEVDGRAELRAPRPGLWRGAPAEGSLVRPGSELGELEILGVLHRLRAPAKAFGVVDELPAGRRLARRPVDFGTRLFVLDPEGVSSAVAGDEAEASEADAGGPVFRTPLGGRYYARPAPDAEPFVTAGEALTRGQTVAIIEVMKTFNRVQYDGDPARVREIVPSDGDDLEGGDVLLRLDAT